MDFDSNKLETTFYPPMTATETIENRKYTLTHSDETGMLFLDIGEEYNYSAINDKLRDELLGKWKIYSYNSFILIFYAYVGDGNFLDASMKYSAFKYHMKLALQTIFYGDKALLEKYPYLLNTPIYVKFDSDISMFDNYEPYGFVRDYIL